MQPETQYYRTVPVSEGLPEIDGSDLPEQYIVRFKGDDPRTGWVDIQNMTAEQIREVRYGDYWEWLERIQLPDAERLREALEACFNLCEQLRDKILTAHIYEKDPVTGVNETTEVMRIAREALSQTGDGWVRVEDGLPTEMQYVLVCINEDLMLKGKYVGNGKWSAIYSDGEQVVGPISKVTAWRPLPPQPINK